MREPKGECRHGIYRARMSEGLFFSEHSNAHAWVHADALGIASLTRVYTGMTLGRTPRVRVQASRASGAQGLRASSALVRWSILADVGPIVNPKKQIFLSMILATYDALKKKLLTSFSGCAKLELTVGANPSGNGQRGNVQAP